MRIQLLLFITVIGSNSFCIAQRKAIWTISDTGHTVIDKNIYGQFTVHLGEAFMTVLPEWEDQEGCAKSLTTD